MTKETQAAWPPVKPSGAGRGAPVATFQTPDTTVRSERSLAGPLRMGTAPGVGPKGAPDVGASDFGMDSITPRRADPIGNLVTRAPEREGSTLISRDIRKGKRRGG
jgi:hypothetical protein